MSQNLKKADYTVQNHVHTTRNEVLRKGINSVIKHMSVASSVLAQKTDRMNGAIITGTKMFNYPQFTQYH